MKLLLIEDGAQVAAEIRSALQARGYSVEHHSDGRHGQEAALLGDHSVIITDRMLPGVDGLDIVSTLRRSGKSTPVLVLSALDSVDERVKGLRAGGDDYLGKPFSIDVRKNFVVLALVGFTYSTESPTFSVFRVSAPRPSATNT